MAFIFPVIAGVSATCALGFYTYTGLQTSRQESLTKANAEAREASRRETLAELLKFGPRRVERMCLEAGVRFRPRGSSGGERNHEGWVGQRPDDEDDDGSLEERIIYDGLLLEMTALLKAEIRKGLRPTIEAEIRSELRTSIAEDLPTISRLREEARKEIQSSLRGDRLLKAQVRDEIKCEFKESIKLDYFTMSRLREEARHEIKKALESDNRLVHEVRDDVKREIRRQWAINGQETALIQEAKGDLRDEERAKSMAEMENDFERRLANEMRQEKTEMKKDFERRLAIIKRKGASESDQLASGTVKEIDADEFLVENSSVWSADGKSLAPTRRR